MTLKEARAITPEVFAALMSGEITLNAKNLSPQEKEEWIDYLKQIEVNNLPAQIIQLRHLVELEPLFYSDFYDAYNRYQYISDRKKILEETIKAKETELAEFKKSLEKPTINRLMKQLQEEISNKKMVLEQIFKNTDYVSDEMYKAIYEKFIQKNQLIAPGTVATVKIFGLEINRIEQSIRENKSHLDYIVNTINGIKKQLDDNSLSRNYHQNIGSLIDPLDKLSKQITDRQNKLISAKCSLEIARNMCRYVNIAPEEMDEKTKADRQQKKEKSINLILETARRYGVSIDEYLCRSQVEQDIAELEEKLKNEMQRNEVSQNNKGWEKENELIDLKRELQVVLDKANQTTPLRDIQTMRKMAQVQPPVEQEQQPIIVETEIPKETSVSEQKSISEPATTIPETSIEVDSNIKGVSSQAYFIARKSDKKVVFKTRNREKRTRLIRSEALSNHQTEYIIAEKSMNDEEFNKVTVYPDINIAPKETEKHSNLLEVKVSTIIQITNPTTSQLFEIIYRNPEIFPEFVRRNSNAMIESLAPGRFLVFSTKEGKTNGYLCQEIRLNNLVSLTQEGYTIGNWAKDNNIKDLSEYKIDAHLQDIGWVDVTNYQSIAGIYTEEEYYKYCFPNSSINQELGRKGR